MTALSNTRDRNQQSTASPLNHNFSQKRYLTKVLLVGRRDLLVMDLLVMDLLVIA